MNLTDFFNKYPDEASCIEAFKQKRIEIGVVCKKCHNTAHSFRKCDLKFECKTCKSRQGLRSGTVMENSNLPFRYWMLCIEFMTLTKKSFSALEMQRLIGHKRYEPIWLMMHKIRRVMSKRDDEYQLSNYIEIDEGFFERVDDKEVIEMNKNDNVGQVKKNKRGRGSERQTKVLVMVESKKVVDPLSKHKPDRKVGFLKMKVMEDLTSKSILKEVKKSISRETTVLSDGYRSYNYLKSVLEGHEVIVEADKSKSAKLFPWVNRTISNAKKSFLGTYHNAMNDKFMQNYLDEFCYKFNRRYFGENLYERLLLATLKNTWY